MVYFNHNRNIGIIILDGRKYIHIVRREADHLYIDEIPLKDFDLYWTGLDYPLLKAVDAFLKPSRLSGISPEQNRAYDALKQFRKGLK